jgi:hypothetical protein
MNYLGDFAEDATIHFAFTTHAATGAPVAPSTAFEIADIIIYKNGSATQKTTTNGMTMTSPFDSITGLHTVDIDTSVDTGDSGFWTAGADYMAVLSPDETVDGLAVLKVVASWSIENRNVKATLSASERTAVADAILDLAAGIETGVTPRQAARAMAAVLTAVLTGAGTATEVFKAIGNSGTTRVTVTTDANGNRSAVVLG